MCDGKAIQDMQDQIDVLTEERDDWHAKFAELAGRVTPKGSNVSSTTWKKRRASNKRAKAARKRNRA